MLTSAIEARISPVKQYKIRARGMSRCPDTSMCRMEISVGQSYHEADKLRCALEWAERFPAVHLLIGDSPQRFNLMYEKKLSEGEAEKEARKMGDCWLARNATILSKHPRFKYSRWNDWKQTKDYITTRWLVGRLYRDNPDFQRAIDDATRDTFIRRGYKDWERFSALSRQYLLEESTVFALAYGRLRGFSAYPGSFLDIWNLFLDREILGAPDGFRRAHHVTIGFDLNS